MGVITKGSQRSLRAPLRLSFVATTCPEGMHIFEPDAQSPPANASFMMQQLSKSSGPVLRFKSDRIEKRMLSYAALDDLVSVRFANIREGDLDELLRFLRRFGQVHPTADNVDVVWRLQGHILVLIADLLGFQGKRICEDPVPAKLAALVAQLERFPPLSKLIIEDGVPVGWNIECRNLYQFMQLEVLLAHWDGARAHQCHKCLDVFVVGPGSGRSKKAIYCSDRCRQAAFRRRNKSVN